MAFDPDTTRARRWGRRSGDDPLPHDTARHPGTAQTQRQQQHRPQSNGFAHDLNLSPPPNKETRLPGSVLVSYRPSFNQYRKKRF